MKRKLGINTDCLNGAFNEVSTLVLAHDVGFEAITTATTSIHDVCNLKNKADALGIDFPYLHSPFKNINSMWLQGEDFRTVYNGIIESIDSASACGVDAVVVHVSSGWQAPPVNDLGLSRFDSLVEYAADKKDILPFFVRSIRRKAHPRRKGPPPWNRASSPTSPKGIPRSQGPQSAPRIARDECGSYGKTH